MVTTQKLRVVFYLVGIFKTSSMRDSISSNVARTLRRRRGEEPGYIEGLQQRAGSLNIKRVLQIKENQTSQVKEFSTFLCMGRCKSRGWLNSLLLQASQLFCVNILCFHILSSFGAYCREWLKPDDCQIAGIVLFPGCPQAHTGRLQSLMTVTSLFTDMAGNSPSLKFIRCCFSVSKGFEQHTLPNTFVLCTKFLEFCRRIPAVSSVFKNLEPGTPAQILMMGQKGVTNYMSLLPPSPTMMEDRLIKRMCQWV